MINKFDAKVYSIDPTPRSLNHYNDIKLNFGKKNKTIFNESGKLSVFNYNLEKTNKQNFIFINKAIWKENNKKIKLFFPKNQKHVVFQLIKMKNLVIITFQQVLLTIKKLLNHLI